MLSPPASSLELEQSLQNLGASQQQINAWRQNLHPPTNTAPMSIPQQNWQALNLFLLLSTQWRIDGNKPTGIDYGAIAPTAQLAGVTLSPPLFEKLRCMEQVALDIFNAKHEQPTNFSGSRHA